MKNTSELVLPKTPNLTAQGRIAIIMPVYNEVDTIELTIDELYKKVANCLPFVDILIFEDGSKDGTKDILSKLMKKYPKVYVHMSPEKKGYPKAMKEAFLQVSVEKYSHVISIDSDGQYEPNDFYKVFQTMDDTSADIVMGRRISRKEPPYRRILSKGLQLLERIMFPVKCQDVTSVMRLMKVETAHNIASEIAYSKYNFWLEFTARMSLKKLKVVEIPISYRQRFGGSKVYSLKKMPKIILSEYHALRLVKREYSQKQVK